MPILSCKTRRSPVLSARSPSFFFQFLRVKSLPLRLFAKFHFFTFHSTAPFISQSHERWSPILSSIFHGSVRLNSDKRSSTKTYIYCMCAWDVCRRMYPCRILRRLLHFFMSHSPLSVLIWSSSGNSLMGTPGSSGTFRRHIGRSRSVPLHSHDWKLCPAIRISDEPQSINCSQKTRFALGRPCLAWECMIIKIACICFLILVTPHPKKTLFKIATSGSIVYNYGKVWYGARSSWPATAVCEENIGPGKALVYK